MSGYNKVTNLLPRRLLKTTHSRSWRRLAQQSPVHFPGNTVHPKDENNKSVLHQISTRHADATFGSRRNTDIIKGLEESKAHVNVNHQNWQVEVSSSSFLSVKYNLF